MADVHPCPSSGNEDTEWATTDSPIESVPPAE